MPDQQTHSYRVVDVFTQQALEGNPLAVFRNGSELSGVLMQKIARELNLSETVFVLPSENPAHAAKLRIFTPGRELPFAGHPTVGASFVLLDENIVPAGTRNFIVEEGVGPVPIRVEPGDRPLIWLTTPPIQFGQTFDRSVCASSLGLDPQELLPLAPQFVSAGNPAVFIGLRDRAAVDRAWIDLTGAKQMKASLADFLCVFVFAPTSEGAYSRMFAPEYGIAEDPATGSTTGPLAAYMLKNNLISGSPGTRFVSEQGTKMGRRSLLHVQINGEQGADGIEVGGYVTPLIDAQMRFSVVE